MVDPFILVPNGSCWPAVVLVKRKDRLQATEQAGLNRRYDVRPAVRKGMVFTHDMADWLSFNIDEAWLAENIS